LVTSEWNSELSNAPFPLKKAKLASNALRLNSDYFAENITMWSGPEIRKRAGRLAVQFLAAWPSFAADAHEVSDNAEKSEFDSDAFERVAVSLGSPLMRMSPSKYESTDGRCRLIGMCSRRYYDKEHAFWFGFSYPQRDFLSWPQQSWVALECESAETILLVRFDQFRPLLEAMHATEGSHWHISIQIVGTKYLMSLPVRRELVDITSWLLPTN
jgi:hypothetical protein